MTRSISVLLQHFSDAGFTNISSVEVLVSTATANLDVTVGAKAQNSGLASVIGAGGADTVDFTDTDFTTAINFSSGAGEDMMTTSTAARAAAATFAAGADADTLRLTSDAQTAADSTFANFRSRNA